MIRRIKSKDRKSGFTLAELLIVVAIIAVLVAIAIPIFINQLDRSKAATTTANIRAAYAEAKAASISEDDSADNVRFVNGDTSLVEVTKIGWKGTSDGYDWKEFLDDLPLDDTSLASISINKTKTGTATIRFSSNDDGSTTIRFMRVQEH